MDFRDIARTLKGRLSGNSAMVCCPAHDDRTPSLSIRENQDGTLLFYCFAGCDQQAVAVALEKRGLFKRQGFKPDTDHSRWASRKKHGHVNSSTDNSKAARSIWQGATPISGSVGERYLRNRGISMPIPKTLKFAHLKHGPTAMVFPTIVTCVQDHEGRFCAIHRTYLKPDGSGKAGVSNPKMALGPITGGTARFAAASDTVALVEGIEDALAVQQMTGQPAWACLGTSGFKNFMPPPRIKKVILAPDADDAGDAVIRIAAPRLQKMGVAVLTVRPPIDKDWCDILSDFEERAAFLEFSGEEERKTAELRSWMETIGIFKHD